MHWLSTISQKLPIRKPNPPCTFEFLFKKSIVISSTQKTVKKIVKKRSKIDKKTVCQGQPHHQRKNQSPAICLEFVFICNILLHQTWLDRKIFEKFSLGLSINETKNYSSDRSFGKYFINNLWNSHFCVNKLFYFTMGLWGFRNFWGLSLAEICPLCSEWKIDPIKTDSP